MDKAMTELREKVFSEVLGTINAHSCERIECQQADADKATDAIMALIDRSAPVVVRELEWQDDGLHCWSADTPFGPYMIRKWGHPRIDYGWWPAFDDSAEAEDVDSHEAAKAACQADYTRRILSAVNAVSEAQAHADERERLARRAEAYVWSRPESCAQMREYVAQWLREQEGGK